MGKIIVSGSHTSELFVDHFYYNQDECAFDDLKHHGFVKWNLSFHIGNRYNINKDPSNKRDNL